MENVSGSIATFFNDQSRIRLILPLQATEGGKAILHIATQDVRHEFLGVEEQSSHAHL